LFPFFCCWPQFRLIHQKTNNENNKSNNLGSYLAGLIESDGSIIVPKLHKNEKSKLLYPKVKITFVEKDKPLANKIKEILQSGTIECPRGTKYVNYLIQDISTLQKIAVLLNGKMRTPKIEALHRLIDWLNNKNSKYLLNTHKIPKLGLNESNLNSDAWLSGFIEGDGNFYFAFNFNSEGIATQIKHYMRISQKTTYGKNTMLPMEINSNFHIMDKIKEFLDVKNVVKTQRIKEKYVETSYEVRTAKIASCEILINYLSIYPLFSSKHQDFLSWCNVHKIRVSKEYQTIKGTTKLISLKNGMNTLRTQFNWDSLNKFYNV